MSDPPSTSAFYSRPNEAEVLGKVAQQQVTSLVDFFELSACADWILSANLKKVALQLSDELLSQSRKLVEALEERLKSAPEPVKLFVLADTSYRSCCVDAVAARHANCDGIIHFGESCLSGTDAPDMRVKFVFGRKPSDLDALKRRAEQFCTEIPPGEPILLLTEAGYNHEIVAISAALQVAFGRSVSVAEIAGENAENLSLGRRIPPEFANSSSATLVFVGTRDCPLLSLFLLENVVFRRTLHIDPESDMSGELNDSLTLRHLRRRLFLIEKVRDARTLGLVVGTASVAGHRAAVERMRALCTKARKKLYVVAVGKINVAKLSNFGVDIDAWIVVSCPLGVMLDTSDYYKPLVSYFEAERALNADLEAWAASGEWTASFGAFLNEPLPNKSATDETEPDVSLISGQIRAQPRSDDDQNAAGQVQLYSAGDYFAQRSWRGLDPNVREDENPIASLESGRKGVASGYENESN